MNIKTILLLVLVFVLSVSSFSQNVFAQGDSTFVNAQNYKGDQTTKDQYNLAISIFRLVFALIIVVGMAVVTPSAVLATHISEMLKSHSDQIMTRQDVHELIENLKKEQPKLIEEIIPNLMTTGDLEKILKNLLSERVSVRDLGTILESVSDHIKDEKDLDILTEFIRQKMGHSISAQYKNPKGEIHTLTLAPELESKLSEAIEQSKRNGIRTGQALAFTLRTPMLQKLFAAISAEIDRLENEGKQPVLITATSIRVYLRKLLEPIFKNFVILSYAEIASDVDLHSLGMLRIADES
jgi:flagellar biosynthesis protein FlhA